MGNQPSETVVAESNSFFVIAFGLLPTLAKGNVFEDVFSGERGVG